MGQSPKRSNCLSILLLENEIYSTLIPELLVNVVNVKKPAIFRSPAVEGST